MRRNRFWLAGLVACLALALGGFADHKPGHKKPGGGGGGQVPLSATFRDFPGDFSTPPDRIKSDGMGPYTDGVDKVQVRLDKDANIRLSTSTGGPGSGSGIRQLSLDFRAPASATFNRPFETDSVDAGLRTLVGGLDQLTVDTSTGSSLRIGFQSGGKAWGVRFEPSDRECSGSSTVTVTRSGQNSWEIEAASNAIACLLTREQERGTFPFLNQGNFFMPFKVTVVRKP